MQGDPKDGGARSVLSGMAELSTQAGSTPSSSGRRAAAEGTLPTQFEIHVTMLQLVREYEFDPSSFVVVLAYLDKLCEVSPEAFMHDTWQRIVFAALLLASKVWYVGAATAPPSNLEVAARSQLYGPEEVNKIEAALLFCLGYDVVVATDRYAAALLRLHSLCPDLPDMPGAAAAARVEELEENSLKRQTELLDYLEGLEA